MTFTWMSNKHIKSAHQVLLSTPYIHQSNFSLDFSVSVKDNPLIPFVHYWVFSLSHSSLVVYQQALTQLPLKITSIQPHLTSLITTALDKDITITWINSHNRFLNKFPFHCSSALKIYFQPSGHNDLFYLFIHFILFFFISWRLITLQYCSGFCQTLTWISHGFTCIPHPDPTSHLPLHPIPLGLPSVPGLSTCLMHPTWAGDLFHPR